MLLATWNVNSLTARLPRVLEFLGTHRPDVLCLQETKVGDATFPTWALEEAGYAAAHLSGGRWAGVAVLAPLERAPFDVVRGLPGEARTEEARWVEATVGGLRCVSVYVVNGRALDTPTYEEKLTFLDAMRDRLAVLTAAPEPVFVAGDFNIAPEDRDVWDPALFTGTTHTSRPERERLDRILATGLVDAFRVVSPEAVGFTYYDYRAGMFHKNMGMRIDLALLSARLAPRVVRCGIDRDFRKGLKPSDHAPLLVELSDT
ncbi:MAG TPA: exodeoxyribonuclease III [Mycobacteriales bacterium]|nr:exodeoxyribonuclease III [Mycobacteriales bacterium]